MKNHGTPRESWLKGGDTDADHERFALAMDKCQHSGGFCAEDGECHYAGDCFLSARSARREAAQLIRAITTDSQVVQAHINDAADWILGDGK